jgi:HAD superfamily hydrolase (TIGR01548 family)
MDGVLVDVSDSYRESIRHTVHHFTGTWVTPEQIQEYKNRGGYNNDWLLSQKMAADLGAPVAYETVVEQFQRFFFGANNDGLILRERWLANGDLLPALAQSYPLAIFTGRLRYEADFTLKRFVPDIPWSVIMADDDVDNSKPAPDGLIQIGLHHPDIPILYFGDTVDDARAARAAGVEFVGLVHARMPRRDEVVDLLRQEGASTVLEDINDIDKVL